MDELSEEIKEEAEEKERLKKKEVEPLKNNVQPEDEELGASALLLGMLGWVI